MAAVDIGSNAMRLTIARTGSDGEPRRLDYLRAPVRLGHSSFLTGRLTDENLEAGVEAMVEFRRRMDALGVTRSRAVATSAVRDAENGGDLVERSRREAGIEIEVIDGAEEARLVWRAVRHRLRVTGRWVLVDLGGGSLEVSITRDDALERSATYPLGTVRLLERAADRGGDSVGEALKRLDAELVLPRADELEGVLATGGNIEALAELSDARPDGTGAARVSMAELRETVARVEALSYEQRIEKLGLRPDRADVIVPAGRIYLRVAELAGVQEMVVPNVGVSDGILLALG